MQLPPFPFTVLDTETTGFIPRVHKVIEFASMRAADGNVVDTYSQLLSVKDEVPPHVQVLTHIRSEDLQGKPRFEEKQQEILVHIGEGTVIIGQNLAFDVDMLKGEGLELSDHPQLDTALLASLVFPELRSYSLGYMSAVLPLSHASKHRALGDVGATLELFSKIWERLQELPAAHVARARELFAKSSKGYLMLFEAIPTRTQDAPSWLVRKKRRTVAPSATAQPLERPAPGTVDVREEALHPASLQDIVNACAADPKTTHWIAVKNLEMALKRLHLPEGVTTLYPPFLLLDTEGQARLSAQDQLTTDEATLLLKLAWFSPTFRSEIAIHGNEKEVWNGKLAATEQSAVSLEQFQKKASVFLLDHRQLLQFLVAVDHPAQKLLDEQTHIIVDDASMLEDTATKAYGFECSLDDVRAAARGDDALMKFVDLATLWTQKIRRGEDLHFLTREDLHSKDAQGLSTQLATLKERKDLSLQTRVLLDALSHLLDIRELATKVMWLEQRYDGSIQLHAAPEHVDQLLDASLFNKHPTTLLTPAGCDSTFPETLPAQRPFHFVTAPHKHTCTITSSFPKDTTVQQILSAQPAGKTIILMGSKRLIEQAFIQFTEPLEQKGVTLICQGLSGGQNRMEAEFIAAAAPTVWLLTPWTYEGIDLPDGTADHLVIDALPFDHPGHPVFQRRKQHYKDAFGSYCVPRLCYRLFRLLRTFCRHKTKEGDVQILDPRLFQKNYGKEVMEYVAQFGAADAPRKEEGEQMKLF